MLRDKYTLFGWVTEKGVFDTSSPDIDLMQPSLRRFDGKFVMIEIKELTDQRLEL